MATAQEQYDSLFLGILQNEGPKPIASFLDIVFSFLYRRTDFYITMKTPTDAQGFPPGVAQKLVLQAFKVYADLAEKDSTRKQKLTQKPDQRQRPEVLPPVAKVKESSTDGDVTKKTNAGLPAVPQSTPAALASNVTTAAEKRVEDNQPQNLETKETPQNPLSGVSMDPRIPDDPDENPELARLQSTYQDNPLSHNGAIRDRYLWSQSITDLDVRIKVPTFLTKGKDAKVDIARRHLVVKFRGDGGEWQTAVDEDLCWDVNKEESLWSLDPGKYIHVNLEKVKERWWEAVLVSEPRISVRKIDPSRPMTDLDDEAQAKIEEMMYNERQKRMGLPQSHEQKMEGILKKAWDAEGSPFKGQPFDPSKVSLTANSNPDYNP